MINVNSFYIFNEVEAPQTSASIGNNQANILTIQITGTASDMQLNCMGVVDYKNPEYSGLSYINLGDFSTGTSITKNGIYQFSIEGLNKIQFQLSAISGGAVTVFGRMTKEG